MEAWTTIGLLAITSLMLGLGAMAGGLLVANLSRQRWLESVKYLMDRLKKLEFDQRRAEEDLLILRARLMQSGLLDDEDLVELRRELIERPRQRKAERMELLEEARRLGLGEHVMLQTPETLQ